MGSHACAPHPSYHKLGAQWVGCDLHVATGLRDFNAESIKLAYGEDSPVLANKQVAAVQSLSGTGSCRLFAEFQKRFLPNSSIYIPVVSGAVGFSPKWLCTGSHTCITTAGWAVHCGPGCVMGVCIGNVSVSLCYHSISNSELFQGLS